MIDAWNAFAVVALTVLGAPSSTEITSIAVAIAVVAAALIVLALAGHRLAPCIALRGVFARHGAGRAPTPAQSDPDAPGHPRPRAPGFAAFAA